LSSGASISDVFVIDPGSPVVEAVRDGGTRVHEVSEPVLRAISDTTTPQGVVAVAELAERSLADLDLGRELILVLDQIRDPGNAGTLIRSAVAAGCGGIVFTAGSVDPYAPKTLRAAAGVIFRCPVVAKADLAAVIQHLRGAGFRLVGADARSRQSIYNTDLTGPVAVVLGNESWGLEDASGLDLTAGIPMPGGIESLNAAIAGSVFLFEAVRQRQIASKPA